MKERIFCDLYEQNGGKGTPPVCKLKAQARVVIEEAELSERLQEDDGLDIVVVSKVLPDCGGRLLSCINFEERREVFEGEISFKERVTI